MFGFLKKAANGQFNKYSGNKDFLEAVAAASSLVAAADGSIDDDEVLAAIEAMLNNPGISAAYTASQIEEEMNRQLKRAKTISGKAGLRRELEDVARKDIQVREDVYLAAADVAASDGNIADSERKVLAQIAGILQVDGAKLLAA